MANPLRWRIDPTPLPDELSAAPLAASGSAPDGRRRRTRFWSVYLPLLFLATTIGFLLGRQMEIRATMRQDIQTTLALANLASRRRDVGLLRSTFDPLADPVWIEAERQHHFDLGFLAGESIVEIHRLAPDRVLVGLGYGGEVANLEWRVYRRVGDRWLRTEPLPLDYMSKP